MGSVEVPQHQKQQVKMAKRVKPKAKVQQAKAQAGKGQGQGKGKGQGQGKGRGKGVGRGKGQQHGGQQRQQPGSRHALDFLLHAASEAAPGPSIEGSAYSLEADDAFFQYRLDFVPVKMLVADENAGAVEATRFFRNGKATKQDVKEASKKAKKASKFKLAEPLSNADEIAQRHETAEAEAEAEAGAAGAVRRRTQPAQNIGELRKRLADKLQALKAEREAREREYAAKKPTKVAAAEAGAGAGAEGDAGASAKALRKQRKLEKKEEKRQKKKKQQKLDAAAEAAAEAGAGSATGAGRDQDQDQDSDQDQDGQEADGEGEGEGVARGSLSEDELHDKVKESITFGSLTNAGELGGDLRDDVSAATSVKSKSSSKNIFNVKRMLADAEENKALMEELKRSKRPEDREEAANQSWDRLEQKAVGEKVLEPKHLRKAVKRLEKQKKKSASEWRARKAADDDDKTGRISTREANIDKANTKRVDSKLKRKGVIVESKADGGAATAASITSEGPASGRKRPGFEGKRTSYLNNNNKGGNGNGNGGRDGNSKSGSGKGKGSGSGFKKSKGSDGTAKRR